MKMITERRALDKIFRRRDRYEIPDWQRGKVWDTTKKQKLVDSILRGWKLPKFYFLKAPNGGFEVVDGQQRLLAIFEFCSNELTLDVESARRFGGRFYRELSQNVCDSFDDFEIEYDLIEDATEQEVKEFFQRLQEGLPLTSSEKLNSVDSKLRDYCKQLAAHLFFKETVRIPDTRYAHFDIVSKVATIEIEGPDTGLRFDDIREVFESQQKFSSTSAIGKRINAALDFLHKGFQSQGDSLRTRTVVQSLITLACKLVATGRHEGLENEVQRFFEAFVLKLASQIEMGQSATDSDYLVFQDSVNANVRGGAKTRHQILLRKLFQISPQIADRFDPSIVAETGVSKRIDDLGSSIVELFSLVNEKHASSAGEDLFKATNKTTQALLRIRKPIKNFDGYQALVDDLYFLFHESAGSRLNDMQPASFADVNELRTDLRHDVDHGDLEKISKKRKKTGTVFAKYAGDGTPHTIEPTKFPLVHSNILGAIEGDLRGMLGKKAVSLVHQSRR